jgi:ABC-2 type transport system permease protein
MKTFAAFFKKEWTEWVRSGRLIILLCIFILFGIMNPAMAKLTPWIMETMSESLQSTGLSVTKVEIDALTSWTQFFKNIPTQIIVFILMVSGTFTAEYQRGTLILVLTKGLARWKVFAAKSSILILVWTVCYWVCYGITYFYNDFYWDNGIASDLSISAVLLWLFGVWAIAMLLLFSAVMSTNSAVLAGTGGIAFGSSILGIFPKFGKYLPTKLLEAQALLTKEAKLSDFQISLLVIGVMSVTAVTIGLIAFRKKKL